MYAEVVGINMVDISEEFDDELPLEMSASKENLQTDAEMVTEDN
jgi:hypothetical protein